MLAVAHEVVFARGRLIINCVGGIDIFLYQSAQIVVGPRVVRGISVAEFFTESRTFTVGTHRVDVIGDERVTGVVLTCRRTVVQVVGLTVAPIEAVIV